MVPVAAEKFRASPEMVSVRLALVVALARPLSDKVPNSNAAPPLSTMDVWVDGFAVLVSAVVLFAKNWMVLRLLLTGVPPVHVPWGELIQLSGEVGVPVTLELAQV